MNLSTSLMLIGQRFGFNPDDLIGYAAEDAIGGYHSNGALAKWPMGSLWEVEGKTLYALTRALKPGRALEIGTHRGASATHISAALLANGGGVLDGCDLGDYGGDLMPEVFKREIFTLHHENGIEFLDMTSDETFGLIFEDASHDAATTEAIARLAQTKLTPGGVLVVHDAAHFLVGKDIRAGLDAANLPGGYGVYLCEPSDCGLAVWRKELTLAPLTDVQREEISTKYAEQRQKQAEVSVPKSKRTSKKKAVQ